jgi:hypothetical protein
VYLPFALEVMTLRGEQIVGLDSFVVRATGADDPEDFSRWPDQAVDSSLASFERFGLPARLEATVS